MNRKKKVSGTASQSAMQTHGEGRQEGPVGNQQGYEDRKAQQPGVSQQRSAAGRVFPGQGRPMSRPKTTSGQAGGSMNTSGFGSGAPRPQQTRPSGAASNPFSAGSQPQQGPLQSASQQTQSAYSSAQKSSAGTKRSPMLLIIALAALLLLGGGGGLSGLFGGNSGDSPSASPDSNASSQSSSLLGDLLSGMTGSDASLPAGSGSISRPTATPAQSGASSSSLLQQLLGGSWYGSQTGYSLPASSGASSSSSYTGVLNRNVAAGSREKYTKILGGGRDTVTVMVYMCGADLESKSAMGTRDLQEMLGATLGGKLRLIVYTGGSTAWRNDVISSKVNQVWQVENGKLVPLVKDAGTPSMTNPATLSSFIQFCAREFPANRYALILWDHGSGSVSGYGYDEKNPRSGSMSLAGLNTAFRDGGVQFDFIGFDTCLMATVENALMASKYADYLIASEETEPGIGWYYTDWLTAWGKNTSLSTLDIGKQICDDFVSKCAVTCRGQQATLSVVDLAELENTVPDKLTAFSKSVTSLISNKEYKTVSSARNGSREFAASSRIDQVDLTDLCNNLNTKESAALARVLREAVKYNKINNISNAYGLSIYFPYKKVSNVDKAVSTYAAIGMDASYAQAIRAFASVEASGQAVTGGASSAIPSLFGGGSSASSSASSQDMIGELLSAFLGGGFGRIGGLDDGNTAFLSDRAMSDSDLSSYLAANILDPSQLVFRRDGENWVMDLAPEQWALVCGVDQNVFYDNGAGYVDLGLDNLFEFDAQGRLTADMDGTWLAINGQPVPYYHETSQALDDGAWIITGRVPVLLNGSRADLLIVFDSEHEDGYVAGARSAYTGETETIAKAMTEISDGDTLVFLADLYDYRQQFTDSYAFGDPITVAGELQVSNVYLPDPDRISVTYRITDIYQQAYWTPVIGK